MLLPCVELFQTYAVSQQESYMQILQFGVDQVSELVDVTGRDLSLRQPRDAFRRGIQLLFL